MTAEEKRRQILLQVFAESDEKYSQLLTQTIEVDILLENLMRDLPQDQADIVKKAVRAYMELAWHTAELACNTASY